MKKSEVWYPYLNFAVCPKCFFTDRKFIALSSNAKLLYIFLFDRTRLSAKNGLCDTDDEVFVFCTVETACEIVKTRQLRRSRSLKAHSFCTELAQAL